jgi:hypothetical protein
LTALNRGDEALAALEEARHRGASPEVPCLDPDLASLRGTDRFQALYRCTPAQAAGPAAAQGHSRGWKTSPPERDRDQSTVRSACEAISWIGGSESGGNSRTGHAHLDDDGLIAATHGGAVVSRIVEAVPRVGRTSGVDPRVGAHDPGSRPAVP